MGSSNGSSWALHVRLLNARSAATSDEPRCLGRCGDRLPVPSAAARARGLVAVRDWRRGPRREVRRRRARLNHDRITGAGADSGWAARRAPPVAGGVDRLSDVRRDTKSRARIPYDVVEADDRRRRWPGKWADGTDPDRARVRPTNRGGTSLNDAEDPVALDASRKELVVDGVVREA